MDDYTPQIFGEGGNWSESEVLGNYAVVKARASQATLDTIAADPLFLRIPLDRLDISLGQLTPQQRTLIRGRLQAMGYTQAEIFGSLDSNLAKVTLGQVLRFAASRRHKPRYDPIQDEIMLDGEVQTCRSIESVDAEVSED